MTPEERTPRWLSKLVGSPDLEPGAEEQWLPLAREAMAFVGKTTKKG